MPEKAGFPATLAYAVWALIALPLLSYSPAGNGGVSGLLWGALAMLVFLFWGIQAFIIKRANETMQAESNLVDRHSGHLQVLYGYCGCGNDITPETKSKGEHLLYEDGTAE